MARIRVAVVYGGRSSEHGVSAVSAGAVIAALDPAKYDVVPIGITREGEWLLTEADPSTLRIADRALPEVTKGSAAIASAERAQLVPVDSGEGLRGIDVIFPVLHGRFGEDGTIQGLFEMAGIPYVGAGVFASAAAMDKEFTKKLLAAEGLPVGDFHVVRPGDSLEPVRALGLPLFVKPARAGSSVGISKIASWDELSAAIDEALRHDNKVMIEAAVAGREVECGVLEDVDGRPIASVPAEIRLVRGHDWYDFEAKYLDDACEFDVPADLSDDITQSIRAAACRAFVALDGKGLARVDFFVRPDGSLVINEVNTMPGFTPISMFPRMWQATGIEYPELVDRLIASALRR